MSGVSIINLKKAIEYFRKAKASCNVGITNIQLILETKKYY